MERGYGRSIINSLHAVWSIGAVVGGLTGTLAVGLAVPLGVHLGASAAAFTVVAVVAYRLLLTKPEYTERASSDSNQPAEPPPGRAPCGTSPAAP